MTYLDHDPVIRKLKEADLYVKKGYLGKGGIKSWQLVRLFRSCRTAITNAYHRRRRVMNSLTVF